MRQRPNVQMRYDPAKVTLFHKQFQSRKSYGGRKSCLRIGVLGSSLTRGILSYKMRILQIPFLN